MKKIEETLWAEYGVISEKLKCLEPNDERYELLLGEQDKIRNELLKLEEANMEFEIKTNQIKAEDKREKIRNRINIGTFVITTGVSLYTVIKTFKFDQDATITSTLGGNILRGFIPKMFKR